VRNDSAQRLAIEAVLTSKSKTVRRILSITFRGFVTSPGFAALKRASLQDVWITENVASYRVAGHD
jgi:hypothetical protein